MADYVASAPTTHPAKLLREKNIAIRHLKSLLAEQDEELATREATITEMLLES